MDKFKNLSHKRDKNDSHHKGGSSVNGEGGGEKRGEQNETMEENWNIFLYTPGGGTLVELQLQLHGALTLLVSFLRLVVCPLLTPSLPEGKTSLCGAVFREMREDEREKKKKIKIKKERSDKGRDGNSIWRRKT